MAKKSRKVLFISADQWRAECLSILGHPVVQTPHLDALAKDGVLFRNHYAACSPCGPSRTSMLTGMYLMNHRSGRNGTPLDQRHTNLAWEVRRQGFDPTLFGYTDTSIDPRSRPAGDPALNTYEGMMPGFSLGMLLPEHMAAWIADLRAKGYDVTNRNDVYRPRPGFTKPANRGHSFIPTLFSVDDSETTFMANTFLRWLSVRNHENWFAHLVFLRPHPPIIAPEPYNALYDPADAPMAVRRDSPELESKQHPFLNLRLKTIADMNEYHEHNPHNFIRMPELELRQLRATYYAMITQVDDQIGRIVKYLKDTGQYEDTLIIFTCDHGEMAGDHYSWGKETYFEQSFRIPMIIRDPRNEANATRGEIVNEFTEAIDIMPTILDWLGAEIPPQCDGQSLLPFVTKKEGPDSWRQEVHYELDFRYSPDSPYFDPEAGLNLAPDECYFSVIRDERYKYVHFVNLPPLLFDLQEDPSEMHDLSQDPKHRDRMMHLLQRMVSWRMRYAERTLTHLQLTSKGVIDGRLRQAHTKAG